MRWRRQRRRCAHRRPFWHLQRAPLPHGSLRGPAVLQRRHALDLPREGARGELGASSDHLGELLRADGTLVRRPGRYSDCCSCAGSSTSSSRTTGRSTSRAAATCRCEIARDRARDHSAQTTRVALRRRSSVGRRSSSPRLPMALSARPPPASCSRRSDHPTGESVSCAARTVALGESACEVRTSSACTS